MNNKLFPLILFCVGINALASSEAATIPAGTTLNVRTLDSMLASSSVGRKYKAELAHAVKINGDVVLHAGTPCILVVRSAFGDIKRSSTLELDLTGISINGRTVGVKTTGEFELGAGVRTRNNVSIYGKNYTYPRGTQLTFKLARPVNI
jgi:hypothetical protein